LWVGAGKKEKKPPGRGGEGGRVRFGSNFSKSTWGLERGKAFLMG